MNSIISPGIKVLGIARSEIGYKEVPPNSNKTKYGKWFGWDGQKWCGIFVSWVYDKAGFPLGKIGFTKGFAGTQTALAYFKKHGMLTETPRPGDVVFFDWQLDGRPDHVGIFQEWQELGNQKFIAIEGNTSLVNQSNGGEVMERVRDRKFAIFAHPKVLDIKLPVIKKLTR